MKTDARVRYTQMRIKEAFLTQLREKPVSKITVKEICDIAEINRATFYKHYADPFDLLDKMEEDALAWLEKTIADDAFQQGAMLTILRHLCDQSNPYGALTSTNGDPNFAGRLSMLFHQKFCPQMKELLPTRTEDERNSAYLFIVGGCGHLLAQWIKDGQNVPPEVLAQRLESMTDLFIRAYDRGLS